MSLYYISVGSNMGDRFRYLVNAVFDLKKRGIQMQGLSSIYETEPWGKTDQTPFLNAVLAVEWIGEAEELLDILQATEIRFGRVRHEKWGPRTLDLDLIYSDDKSCCTDRLTLPHPYFWERLFVLVPLEELSPDFFWEGQSIHNRITFLEGGQTITKWSHQW